MALTEESKEKGRKTRERNAAARAQKGAEQAEAIRTARLALTKVFQSEDATAEQILEAARLLEKIGSRY